MKKFILISFFLFLFSQNTSFAEFSDVSDSPYISAISWMETEGIIVGYPDGTFRPENNITRAEFVKILYETMGFDKNLADQVDLPFSDVNENDWYIKYVKEAYKENSVDGYPDGTFRPNDNINIAEAYKIVMNAFFDVNVLYGGSYIPCNQDLTESSKIDTNGWYWKYLYVADAMCLVPEEMISRMAQEELDPGEYLQRGEMAELIYGAKGLNGIEQEDLYNNDPLEYFSEYVGTALLKDIAENDFYNYYEVKGTTDTALREQMSNLGPRGWGGEEGDAVTMWTVFWSYSYSEKNGECSINNSEVSLDVDFTYPLWTNLNEGSEELVQKWENYMGKISIHENGHKEHGIKAANEIYENLNNFGSYDSCEDLDEAANEQSIAITDKYYQEDKDYDEETGHGETQGCKFP